MPRDLQHPLRRGAELLPHFGHHLFGQVQQHELHVGGSKPICLAAESASARSWTSQFGPRVRRADDHDRPPRAAPAGIVVDIGHSSCSSTWSRRYSASAVDFRPAGVLRETGHVEQPGHRTRRQHQAIPRQVARRALRVGERDRPPVEVDAVDPAADRLHAPQRVRERDRDEPGVDQPPATSGSSGV